MTDSPRPDAIAREIRNEILSGRYRPGERLPSERELANRVGANRGSAREALRILAQQRLIEIRPGGSRVIPVHRASLDVLSHLLQRSDGLDAALMAQLLDVHELLLAGAVRLAVERATELEISSALELLDAMSIERTSEAEYLRTITALVELIAEASHNLVLRMVCNGLLAILATVVPVLQRLRPPRTALAPALSAARKALVRRDADAAERAIRSFLRIQREYVLKRLERASALTRRAAPEREEAG